jgi:hypothetical protein
VSGFDSRASGVGSYDRRRPIAECRNLTRLQQLFGLKLG